MKTRMFKHLFVLLAVVPLLLAGSHAVFAQGGVRLDSTSKEAFKALFRDLTDWAQENIIPTVREWKTSFDNSLSREDLRLLNSLRDRATQMKNDGRRYALALRRALQNNNPERARFFRRKLEALKQDRQALLNDLKPIALRYKTGLERIGAVAKPHVREWKAELGRIGREWYQQHQQDLSPVAKRALRRALAKMKLFDQTDEATRAKIAAARFLLWDGSDLPQRSWLLDAETPDLESNEPEIPDGYSLESNYPNPFNPTTTIVFVIPKSERVALKIYDQLGREVAVLLESELAAGRHTVVFDAKNLASGVYIYRLQAGAYVLQKQMQLIK